MTVDARLERLYQQIELVRGIGDPNRRRLCIMSFVAFLTGEAHTDRPSTVSSLIRRFAMVINDEMPDSLRQRLKSFAPRLIGTKDDEDHARAQLLVDAAQVEILPRIAEDFGRTITPSRCAINGKGPCKQPVTLHELAEKVAGFGTSPGTYNCEDMAAALAQLLAHCGKAAPASLGDWYWLKAIDLLDRLSDFTTGRPRPEICPERLVSLEAFLTRRSEMQQHKMRAAAAFARVRSFIPAFMR